MKTKKLKIAAISDIHSKAFRIDEKADIWIFAGDYADGSNYDMFKQVSSFWSLLYNLELSISLVGRYGDKPRAIFITWGNHDAFAVFDNKHPLIIKKLEELGSKYNIRIEVLVNEIVEFEGLTIYGAPYSSSNVDKNTRPFSWTDKAEKQVHQVLRKATPDIMFTHSPPYKILDINLQGKNVGDWHWKEYLNGYNPQLWIFGHIHNSHGTFKDEITDYYNVAYKKEHTLGKQEPNGVTYIEKEFIVKDKSYTVEIQKGNLNGKEYGIIYKSREKRIRSKIWD